PFIIGHPGFQDEGRGLLLRNIGYRQERNSITAARANRSPLIGYIDQHGQSREIAVGLVRRENGNFVKSSAENASAQIFSTIWSWDEKGPGANKQINYFSWGGLSEMINNTDGWQGADADFLSVGIKTPTYPSGEAAKGYSGPVAPQNSKFYDALGGKDIFGRIAIQFQPYGGDEKGLVSFQLPQGKFNTGHIRIAKDTLSRWWLDYNINVAKSFLSRDVDGFWIDHASGLHAIGLAPVTTAFGDWSVDAFNKFLSTRTDWKGSTNIKIKDYILDGAKSIDSTFNKEKKDLGAPAFKSTRWLKDPTWLAFLAYKSILTSQRGTELYTAIKDEAKNAGKNPEAIMVGASDIPVYPFATARGLEADQIHTRYSHLMSPEVGSLGRGLPMRGSNGPFYNLSSALTKSTWSHIWYILPPQMQISAKARANLAPVLAAEALANNAILAGDDTHERFALTNDEGLQLAKVLDRVGPTFQGRDRYARVGIIYSPNSLYSTLTPGGFAGANQELPPKQDSEPSVLHHGMAVQGWAEFLESKHLPYRVIPDFRLSEKALRGIQVLIIPHVTAFEREWIQKALKPYLVRVGLIIMTGANHFGETRTVDFLFSQQGSLLNELKAGENPERFTFINGNPGADFHNALMTDQTERLVDLQKELYKPFASIMDEQRIPLKILYLPPKLEQTTRTVTHSRRGDKEYFFDFYNTNVDELTMEAKPSDGGKVTLVLPGLVPEKLSIRWYDETKNNFINLPSGRNKEGDIVLQIPGFKHYGSIHVSGIL
ncbi:MAG: hypothetical protein K2X47_09395, partial [Bdellovibrionales bacterium]|nr:hypothetical protein [Bdellovibrionales bacterium]